MDMEQQKKIFNLKSDIGNYIIDELLKSFPDYCLNDIHNNELFMFSETCINLMIDKLSDGRLKKNVCGHCNKDD